MCYICNCFSWTLDLVQRVLTFILSCWLVLAVCVGAIIATVAGIAYGYNYCLAEYLTLYKNDLNIYMRRGQVPEAPKIRRMGFENLDLLTSDDNSNNPGNQEIEDDGTPLSDTWARRQDTRLYAERLTKFAEHKENDNDQDSIQYKTLNHEFKTKSSLHIKSISRDPMISTSVWERGVSEIVMRHYQPMHDIDRANNVDNDEKQKTNRYKNTENSDETTQTITPDIKIMLEDSTKG
ncbi:uncharacterized protein LOC126979473 [Leptidea sinapis]|nr:uncharacterized protein LOC126979473 [Leptidea sinapis]